MTKISEIGGEQALIKRIQSTIKTSSEVIVGIGDDAAIIKSPKNKNIAITTDMLTEDTHFSLSTHTAEQIGRKSAVSNISDIAAMGATPKHMLISLAIPKTTTVEFIDSLYKGITKETNKHKINIIGGDITSSKKGALTISITLTGETGTEIRRSGAKPGDILMVTGDLGKSAAGLHLLRHNPKISKKSEQALKKAHLEPDHRLKESQTLKKTGCITSMNDISDGLATETKEICEASQVGAVIYKDRIPTSPATDELLKKISKDTKETALYGGEDFELLFTAKEQDTKKIIDTLKKQTGTKATIIGKITKEKEIYLVDKNKKTELKKTGYDHFKENPFDYK